MTLELNASDDRGIAVVRQEIQDFASTKSVFCTSFKLIVLDECDAMTKDAQFALRRVIEKYARYGYDLLACGYCASVCQSPPAGGLFLHAQDHTLTHSSEECGMLLDRRDRLKHMFCLS